MEDRFEKLTKTTSGWVYFVKYFDELEIKQDKGSCFKGFPFSIIITILLLKRRNSLVYLFLAKRLRVEVLQICVG